MLVHVYGWWDYAPEERALVNTVTEERVVHRRAARRDEVQVDGDWHLFEYRHDDIRVPLLVRSVVRSSSNDTYSRRWVVDYDRSLVIWRQETGATDLFFPYGLWRRVEECVMDAFSRWLRVPPGSDRDISIYAYGVGGWLNGTWRGEYTRTRHIAVRRDERPPARPDLSRSDIALVPPDMPPPPRWEFHDVPRNADGSLPDLPDCLRPSELRRIQFDGHYQRYLPTTVPAKQLCGGMPYMITEDEKKVLLLDGGDSFAGRHTGYKLSFMLIYPDFLAKIFASPPFREGSDWSIYPIDIIPRSHLMDALSQNDRTIDSSNISITIGQYIQFQRETLEILPQSFLTWKGSKARSSRWNDRLKLYRGSEFHLSLIVGHSFIIEEYNSVKAYYGCSKGV